MKRIRHFNSPQIKKCSLAAWNYISFGPTNSTISMCSWSTWAVVTAIYVVELAIISLTPWHSYIVSTKQKKKWQFLRDSFQSTLKIEPIYLYYHLDMHKCHHWHYIFVIYFRSSWRTRATRRSETLHSDPWWVSDCGAQPVRQNTYMSSKHAKPLGRIQFVLSGGPGEVS